MTTTLDVYDVPAYAIRPQNLDLPNYGNSTNPAPTNMPPSISQDQLYFWSAKWQNDEHIAEIELERGEGVVFESARDAVTWLLDVTDDDE